MRTARVLLAILLLLLAAAAYRVVASGRLHETLRTALISEARRSLDREVAIGAIRGNPFRGIVLEEIAVAREDTLTTGTLFTARRAIFRFNIPSLLRDLATGRGPLPSVTHVTLMRPELILERSPEGRWNVLDLFAGGAPSAPLPSFTPAVAWEDGVITLTDWLGPSRRPFAARFERVTGTVALRDLPTAAVETTMVSVAGDRRSPITVRGRYAIGEGAFDIDLTARQAPISQWGPYIARQPQVSFEGGTFDSDVRLLSTRWGNRLVLDYHGTLRLYEGEALLLPQRARIRDARGVVQLDTQHLQTDDLRLAVDGSPLRVRGEISTVHGGRLDLVVSSPAVDLATVSRLLFPASSLQLRGFTGGEVRVTGPLDAPTVEGTLVDARGTVNRQSFSAASADVTLAGGLLAVERFEVAAGNARLGGDLALSLEGPGLLLAVEGRNVTPEMLRRAGLSWTLPVQGLLSGSLALGRTRDRLIAEGAAAMGRGRAGGIRVDALEAGLWYLDGEVTLPYVVAARGAATVHASGTISRNGGVAIDLATNDVNLRQVAAETGFGPWLRGEVDADGLVTGTLRQPVFNGAVAVGRGSVGPLAFDGAEGTATVTRRGLATPGLIVRDGVGSYFVSGSARWTGPGFLDLAIDARDIPAGGLARAADIPLDVTGGVSGRVTVGGTPGRPSVGGRLTLREARIEGQRVDEVTGAFRWKGGRLHVDQLQARVGDSAVTAQGTIDRHGPLSLGFAARGFDLTHLTVLPPQLLHASGKVDLAGRISGHARAPVVSATLSSKDLVLNGQGFDRAEGTVRWERGLLHLAPLALQEGESTYTVRGTLALAGPHTFDLRGEVTRGRLSTLLALGRVRPPFPLDGLLDGVVTVQGTRDRPTASLNATLARGRLGDHAIDEAQVNLGLHDGVITVQQLSVRSGDGLLAAQGRLALQGESQLEVGGTNLNLDLLRPLLGLRRKLGGTMNFTAQFSGTLQDPEVGLSVDIRNGGINGLTFDSLVANAFYKNGQFNVEQALLTEGSNKVKGVGTIPFNPALRTLAEQRPMRFEISLVDASLSLLTLLTPQVQEAAGRLEGQVLLSGTPRQPQMTGRLTVRDGRIRLRSIVTILEEVQADVAFSEDRMTIRTLTARLGSGMASATGTIAISDFRLSRIEELRVRAQDARLEITPVFAGRVDADLTFSGPLGDPARPPEVAGQAVLKEGDVVIAGAKAGAGPGGRRPNLSFRQVRMVGGPGLALHLGRLRIEVKEGSAVLLGGTLHAPALDGDVTAERGTLTALGQTFILREGQARFLPQLGVTPIISAQAETRVGATRVFIEVQQALPDELGDRLILRSDPPMSRGEIVALLARQSGLAHLASGDVEAALRVELSRALFGQVGETIARALGLDEFTIQYDAAQPLQLRIGRLLVRDFFVTLTTVFHQERTRFIWALEWRFARNLMLTLTLDNFGRTDTLLLYTIRF